MDGVVVVGLLLDVVRYKRRPDKDEDADLHRRGDPRAGRLLQRGRGHGAAGLPPVQLR